MRVRRMDRGVVAYLLVWALLLLCLGIGAGLMMLRPQGVGAALYGVGSFAAIWALIVLIARVG